MVREVVDASESGEDERLREEARNHGEKVSFEKQLKRRATYCCLFLLLYLALHFFNKMEEIKSFKHLAAKYDTFLFDCDGVFYIRDEPIPGSF